MLTTSLYLAPTIWEFLVLAMSVASLAKTLSWSFFKYSNHFLFSFSSISFLFSASSYALVSAIFLTFCAACVVATTCWNSTCDMLTSAKLSVGYLVVEITRELDKEPSLYYSSIYINISWSVLQQYLLALISMPLSHVLLLIHMCFS